MNTDDVNEKIVRVQGAMAMNIPFIAALLFEELPIMYSEDCPTAWTNGKIICVGDWFMGLELSEQVWVVSHEVLHYIFMHCLLMKYWRESGLGPSVPAELEERWLAFVAKHPELPKDYVPVDKDAMNVVMDYIINALLEVDAVGLRPKAALFEVGFTGKEDLSAAYCEFFMDRYTPPPPSGEGQGQGEGEGAPQDPAGEGEDEGLPGGGQLPLTEDEKDGQFDDHRTDDASDMTEWEIEKVRQNVEVAKAQQRTRGTALGNIIAAVEAMLTPQVAWEKELAQYVKKASRGFSEQNWARPHRKRTSYSMVTKQLLPIAPSRRSHKMEAIYVQLDTSGSVLSVIPKFLTEIAGIVRDVKPSRLVVLAVDSSVQMKIEWEGKSQLANIEQKLLEVEWPGGGGTDMCAAVEYIKDMERTDPAVLITLTDGYTPWPDKTKYPHIVVTTAMPAPAYCTTIKIK